MFFLTAPPVSLTLELIELVPMQLKSYRKFLTIFFNVQNYSTDRECNYITSSVTYFYDVNWPSIRFLRNGTKYTNWQIPTEVQVKPDLTRLVIIIILLSVLPSNEAIQQGTVQILLLLDIFAFTVRETSLDVVLSTVLSSEILNGTKLRNIWIAPHLFLV